MVDALNNACVSRIMKGHAMNLKIGRAGLLLEPHQTLGLHDAVGAQIQVRRGKVWITQHQDDRDLMVDAGAAFTLDRPGLALVHALETAEVAVAEPAPARHRWWGAAGRWIAWAFGPESIERYRPGHAHRYL
jgi:hypothetical protein